MLYRPYSLAVVCATGALPAEHFTVSAAGVTHVCGGGGTDFTPLGQWAREALLLSLLCRIPFFCDFLAGRAFRSWHRVCRARLKLGTWVLHTIANPKTALHLGHGRGCLCVERSGVLT